VREEMITVDARKGRELIEEKIAKWGSLNSGPSAYESQQKEQEFSFQPAAKRRKSGKGDKADLRDLARKLGLGKTLPESKR
jgi:hypothetical protein